MKKIIYIAVISLLFITSFTGCINAELEDIPYLDQVDDGFTVAWTDQGPSYTLILKPVNDVEIENVHFLVAFKKQEKNAEWKWIHYIPDVREDNTYNITDFERDFKPGDRFTGYAVIYTSVGKYKTTERVSTAQ